MGQSDMEIDAENYENCEGEDAPFGKKIKLEHYTICERLNEKFPDIDIKEHEIQKFLLIFQELITLPVVYEEFSDSEDGITNLFLTLAKQIQNFLNKDTNFLKFQAVIKKSLKTLKALLNLFI